MSHNGVLWTVLFLWLSVLTTIVVLRSNVDSQQPNTVELGVKTAIPKNVVALDASASTDTELKVSSLEALVQQMSDLLLNSTDVRLATLESLHGLLNESFTGLITSLHQRLPAACAIECSNGGTLSTDDCSCTCAPGWTGPSCVTPQSCAIAATAACNSGGCQCEHGGSWDIMSCTCNCFLGWSGTFCQDADSTASPAQISASIAQQLSEMTAAASSASATSAVNSKFAALADSDAVVFANLRTTIGTTVQSFSRKHMGIPVLAFTYNQDDPSKWWLKPSGQTKGQIGVAPNEVEMTLLPGTPTSPLIDVDVYQSLNDFVQNLLGQRTSFASPAPAVVTTLGFGDLAGQLFSGDQFYSRATAAYPYYHLTLPVNTAAQTRRYPITSDFARLLLRLPPYSSSTQEYYFQVLDALGDSVIVEVEEGGIVEQWTTLSQSHMSSVADKATIEQWALNQMHSNVGQDADNAQAFDQATVASAVYCTGGSSSDAYNCEFNDLHTLVDSFADWPRPTGFRTVPISSVLPSIVPEWQLWWQQAQNDWYIVRSGVYTGASSCPPCAQGTCTQGSIYCECPPDYVGRTCATYIGKTIPASQSISVDNPIQTTNHIEGTTQSVQCPPGTAITSVSSIWAGTCHSSCNEDGHVLRNMVFECTPIA